MCVEEVGLILEVGVVVLEAVSRANIEAEVSGDCSVSQCADLSLWYQYVGFP